MLESGHCPNLDIVLGLLMAQLFAGLQWDLPDEKPVLGLGGQCEIISQYKTVSFTQVWDQLCSLLQENPKKTGLVVERI